MKNKYTVPKRGVWYIFRVIIVTLVVILLAYGVFITAMNAANVYILANEGLSYRVSCILGDGDQNELYAYFTKSCIEKDELLKSNVYQLYSISSYDYRLATTAINIMPWYTTITMEVVERIPSIVGTANLGAPTSAVPLWTAGRYRLVFVKDGSRFLIDKMELLEENPPEEARPTPNMSLLPSPSATPKVSPTVLPSPSAMSTALQTETPTLSPSPTKEP